MTGRGGDGGECADNGQTAIRRKGTKPEFCRLILPGRAAIAGAGFDQQEPGA